MKGERFIAFPRRRRFDPGGLVDQPVLTQLLAMEGQVNLAPLGGLAVDVLRGTVSFPRRTEVQSTSRLKQ